MPDLAHMASLILRTHSKIRGDQSHITDEETEVKKGSCSSSWLVLALVFLQLLQVLGSHGTKNPRAWSARPSCVLGVEGPTENSGAGTAVIWAVELFLARGTGGGAGGGA